VTGCCDTSYLLLIQVGARGNEIDRSQLSLVEGAVTLEESTDNVQRGLQGCLDPSANEGEAVTYHADTVVISCGVWVLRHAFEVVERCADVGELAGLCDVEGSIRVDLSLPVDVIGFVGRVVQMVHKVFVKFTSLTPQDNFELLNEYFAKLVLVKGAELGGEIFPSIRDKDHAVCLVAIIEGVELRCFGVRDDYARVIERIASLWDLPETRGSDEELGGICHVDIVDCPSEIFRKECLCPKVGQGHSNITFTSCGCN